MTADEAEEMRKQFPEHAVLQTSLAASEALTPLSAPLKNLCSLAGDVASMREGVVGVVAVVGLKASITRAADVDAALLDSVRELCNDCKVDACGSDLYTASKGKFDTLRQGLATFLIEGTFPAELQGQDLKSILSRTLFRCTH